MLTVSSAGFVAFVPYCSSSPLIITIEPIALRMLAFVLSAIWPPFARVRRGLIVTRSAPAPLMLTSRMMIRPLEPTPPPPST